MFLLREEPEPGSLAVALSAPAPLPRLFWLGQAGFCLRYGNKLALIDPYLSDALAEKYAGTALPHHRMMPAPIALAELPRVDLVFVTHRHGDHLDRNALPEIASRWPECRILAPHPAIDVLLGLEVSQSMLVPVDAGDTLYLDDIVVDAVPAAHEELDRDEHGHHPYLGYVLSLPQITIYHSGDCVPFPGLSDALTPHRIDLALLPVNGRDARRLQQGIPGNFNLSEAVTLCREQSIPAMIAHHFGMFDFNTVDRNQLEMEAAELTGATRVKVAALHTRYVLGDVAHGARAPMMAGV